MAEATEIAVTRQEHLLRFVEAMVVDIPWVVAEWDQLGEGEWVGFCLDWDLALLTNLVELRREDRRQQLTAAQRARLEVVPRAFRDMQPILASRNLIGFEDVLRAERAPL